MSTEFPPEIPAAELWNSQKFFKQVTSFVENRAYFLEITRMRLEKIVKGPDVFHLRPAAGGDRSPVQVVNADALQGQQEWRVGGNNKLAAIEPGGILQKAGQLKPHRAKRSANTATGSPFFFRFYHKDT